MSQFTTPLKVIKVDDNLWQLLEPFEYHVGCYPSEEIISVPELFKTDFASVPKILWPVLPPWGPYGKAAVVHDWLYWSANYSRKRSDAIFYEGMKVLNVTLWKRRALYQGANILGSVAWNNHRKAKHEFILTFKE